MIKTTQCPSLESEYNLKQEKTTIEANKKIGACKSPCGHPLILVAYRRLMASWMLMDLLKDSITPEAVVFSL